MKSLEINLWLSLYDDISYSGKYHGATRDKSYLLSRIEKEGISFLTIVLPSFARDFERSLDLGYIDSTLFRSFRKRGRIPAFLQGIVSRVFDVDGRIVDKPCTKAIRDVRQLCRVLGKLKRPCTPEREYKAIKEYLTIEEDLRSLRVPHNLLDLFSKVSRELWQLCHTGDEVGKHGPGVTADRLSQDKRRQLTVWPERLETFFPFIGTYRRLSRYDESFDLLQTEQEQPVRVILVPKTQSTPRVIAAEPAAMQFCQQSLLSFITPVITRLSAGIVQFNDQSRNGRLASNVANATIDLSSASDRVHAGLVYKMLEHTLFGDAAFACRSRTAQLPNGHILDLQKFASMGSALCFPIEAMVFFTIVLCYYKSRQPHRRVRSIIQSISDRVGIYGDDIIVPVDDAVGVVTMLESFGLRVNRSKSFWTGKFRESCGKDYYDGQDVNPIYCRSIPSTPGDLEGLASIVAFGNFCYERNYMRTYFLLRSKYRKIPGSTYSGFIAWLGKEPRRRYNTRYQRHEQFVLVIDQKDRRPTISGDDALDDYFQRHNGNVYNPLKVTASFAPLRLKGAWIPCY